MTVSRLLRGNALAAWLSRAALALCLAWSAIGALAMSGDAQAEVLIVLSEDAPVYRQVADAFRRALVPARGASARPATVVQSVARTIGDDALDRYELVVTIGLAAAEAVLRRDEATVPRTLCLLIPKTSFESLNAHRGLVQQRRVSAVYIDQPIGRQLDLIRAAFPDRPRLGVIFGPSSVAAREELRAGARERDLSLNSGEVTEAGGIYAASQAVLADADVLLALPDPVAFNSGTAYLVMLASYRAQIPVVGFSESLAGAGALVAIFSTLDQQGRQGAEMANRALADDTRLESPQYPRYFSVRTNDSVARSLGIRLADSRALEQAVAERARAPRGSAAQRDTGPVPGRSP